MQKKTNPFFKFNEERKPYTKGVATVRDYSSDGHYKYVMEQWYGNRLLRQTVEKFYSLENPSLEEGQNVPEYIGSDTERTADNYALEYEYKKMNNTLTDEFEQAIISDNIMVMVKHTLQNILEDSRLSNEIKLLLIQKQFNLGQQ